MQSFRRRSRKMICAIIALIMLMSIMQTLPIAYAIPNTTDSFETDPVKIVDATQPEEGLPPDKEGREVTSGDIKPFADEPQEAPESYKIYPIPQSIVYQPGGFAISGEVNIYLGNSSDTVTKNKIIAILEDEDIAYSFGSTIVSGKNNIILGVKGGDAAANEYFSASDFANVSALEPASGFDGYVLGTRDNNIVIMGRDDVSVYYGVTTLKQMLSQSHTIRNVLINDFADSNVRGTVEGYYGIPWSFEVRKSIIEMSGDFKLNSYVYAPKDDPYHFGPLWSEPYPADQLEELRQLVKIADANNVSFVWTTHVSQYMDFFDGDDEFNATRSYKTGSQWIESDRTGNWLIPNGQKAIDAYGEAETYAKLFAKFEQLYSIGVRQFGFLIDDINFELARFNILHYVTAANKIVEWGKEKGDVGPLMVCPTYYYQTDVSYNGRTFMRTIKGNPYANNGNGVMVVPSTANNPAWSGEAIYIKEPGFDESIQVMYTGAHVMSSVNSTNNNWFMNTSAFAGTAGENPIYGQTGMRRPPLIWWNYPVTDYMASRIMMGPTPIDGTNMGLNPNAKGTMHGVVANPMQQGHASEIALFGVADYTWHMSGFNARQNWRDSFAYLYPEVADSLYLFAQHNQRGTYSSANMPLNQESAELQPRLQAFQTAISASPLNQAQVQTAGATLLGEIDALEAAIIDVKTNGSKLLVDDLDPWLDKGASLCKAIRYGINVYNAYFVSDDEAVWENYSLAQAEKLSWPSIVAPLHNGTVITEVGTQYLKPFTDTLLTRLDALIASYSPFDPMTVTNRAYTNIPSLKGASISTSGTTRTLSLASLDTLGASRYVGIQLDNVRKLTEISVEGDLPEALTVEYSANGAVWTKVTELPATLTGQSVRYVRIVNNTTNPVSTGALSSLKVTVAVGDTYPGTAATNMPIYQTNVANNITTESLSTSFWSSRAQQVGDQITITYNQPAVIYDLVLYSSNTDNIKEGYMEISEDGETWTKIMDMNVNVSLETVGSTQYAVERAYVGGLTAKYLRIVSTGASSNWCRMYSLRLNTQSGHSNGTVPASVVESGGWALTAVDGNLSTAFPGTGTDKLTYTLSEYTNATELIVLQNAKAVSSAAIRALVIQGGEEKWTDLGVLNKAYWSHSLAAFDRLLKVEISWTPETSPVMIHEIATKTHLGKPELLALIEEAWALKPAESKWGIINEAEAVAYDDNATAKDVADAIVKMLSLVEFDAVVSALVPKPVSVEFGNRYFWLTNESKIFAPADDEEALGVGNSLAEKIRPATGYPMPVVTTGAPGSHDIVLELISEAEMLRLLPGVTSAYNPANALIEAYILEVSAAGMKLSAFDAEGLFRGIQSIRQLLPTEIETDMKAIDIKPVGDIVWTIPHVVVKDYPRYEHRGLMMDVSRAWFPKEVILRQIDLMSQYKLNVMRLHLTEDQGWRLAFDGYPELTDFGSRAKILMQGNYNGTNVVGTQSRLIPGSLSYGVNPGYLTKDDFIEILAYADKRFIKIIPEIEFPSHNYSMLYSLPLLNPGRAADYNGWPIGQVAGEGLVGNSAFWTGTVGRSFSANPTLDTKAAKYTKAFIEDIFDQLAGMMYGRHNIIHVGGDEANTTLLPNADYYQVHKKVIDSVRSNGMKAMGWAPSSARTFDHYWPDIFQSWVGGTNGINDAERPLAANPNCKVVVSTSSITYLDHPSSLRMPVGLNWAASSGIPITTMFNWNPEDRIPTAYRNQGRVIGIEAPLWAETYGTEPVLDTLIYPRALALAEVAWSPAITRSGTGANSEWTTSFQPRATNHGVRLTNQGVTFYNESIASTGALWAARTVNITTANGVYTSPTQMEMNTTLTGKFEFGATTTQGDVVRIKKYSEPSQGKLTLDADGNWAYTPTPGFVGRDSFTVCFQVDGFGIPLNSTTVTTNRGTATYVGQRSVYVQITGTGEIETAVTLVAQKPTNIVIELDPPVPGLLASNFSVTNATVRMAESFDNGSSYYIITTPRHDDVDYTLSTSKTGTPAYTFNTVNLPVHTLDFKPIYFKADSASFIIKPETKIFVDADNAEVMAAVNAMAAAFRVSTGFELPVVTTGEKGIRDISIALIPASEALMTGYDYAKTGATGYCIDIGVDGAFLKAYTPAGIVTGIATMRQLLPDTIGSEAQVSGVDWLMPYAVILDYIAYDVTFMNEGAVHWVEVVGEGNKANVPEEPVKQYYIFTGWYLDDELYDFDTPVIKDITLEAQWIPVPISVMRIAGANGVASASMVTMAKNSKMQFKVIVNSDALPLGVVWSTSNPAFATVDTDGLVTAKAMAGTVTLTVKAPSGVTHSIILRIV